MAEFWNPTGGQVLDLGAGLPGLAGQGLLACVDHVQQQPARVRVRSRGHPVRCHVPRQAGAAVPVSCRAITSVIAQYTRDSELARRCSYYPEALVIPS